MDTTFRASNLALQDVITKAAANGSNRFVIFLENKAGGIPSNKPKILKAEIDSLVNSHKHIESLKFTRAKKIVFVTSNEECAIQLCNVSSLMGIQVSATLQHDSVIKKFLLRNIPHDVPIDEIVSEIEASNDLSITEARRFTRKSGDAILPTESVLISILGSRLPTSIKLWYEIHRIDPFVDKPRQCPKCHKFDHPVKFCTKQQLCVFCGIEGTHPHCTNPIQCANCKENHPANYLQCKARLEEIKILELKEKLNLSFSEARSQYREASAKKSFATVVGTEQMSKLDLNKEINKVVEKSVGPLIKSLADSVNLLAAQQQQNNALITTLLQQVGILSRNTPPQQIPPPAAIHVDQSTAMLSPPTQSPPIAVIPPSQSIPSSANKLKPQHTLPLNKKPKVIAEPPLPSPLTKDASVDLSAMDTSNSPCNSFSESSGQTALSTIQ